MQASPRWHQTTWFAAAALSLLTASVYWPVASFGFLNWDDPWYVVDNPLVKSWAPPNLYAIATEPCSKNFAPLTIFTLLVEHTLFGGWAGGYHLVNALLHAACAVLVLRLVRQATGSDWTGWFTAILFAVHPIQVETVAWVSSLKSLLAALFMLVSLKHWLKPERSARDEGWGLAWLVVALLCKASAVVTPALVLSYDVIVSRQRFSEALSRQVLPGLFCLMALFLNMHAQNQIWGGTRDHYDWGLARILAVDSLIVWRYLGMLALPTDLSVMYDVRGDGLWPAALIAGLAWLAVAGAAWRARRVAPLATWGVVAWGLLLFPVLNIFPITTLMNDRYLYLPCVLAFAGVGAGVQWIAGRIAWRTPGPAQTRRTLAARIAVGAVVAVLLIGLTAGYSTAAQSYVPVWRNSRSLWRHALERAPDMPVVQIQWALTLHSEGRVFEACATLEQARTSGRIDDGDRRRIQRLLEEWRGTPRSEELASAAASH
ncbi:MAG: hypothetical protein KF774_05230 [Planctomyces sp.]|nr:hypothetical protein [Planctomyces sp.]